MRTRPALRVPGQADPQGLSQRRLHELERLARALCGLFKKKSLGTWFDKPNPTFGGLKPVEVVERDRLWQMIFELRAGTHL